MADPHKLDSWKEISTYLGRDERTVQRWAKERALPVHRVPGGKRGGVFVYTHEVEAWLNGQSSTVAGNGSVEPAQFVEVLRSHDESSRPVDSLDSPVGVLHSNREKLRSTARFALWLSAFGLLALAVSTYFILAAAHAGPVLTRATYGASNMVIYGEAGQPLWSYDFPGPLIPVDPSFSSEARQIRILDFDGNGEREVLAIASWRSTNSPDAHEESALFRFSPQGRLLQRYSPTHTLSFNGRLFAPPWAVRAALLTQTNGKHSAWLSFSHHTWWPTMLVHLNENGDQVSRFVHAGWIQTLASMETEAGQIILAGGINNQKGAAMLAVLDAETPDGAGPPDAVTPFVCDNCPAGTPLRYFLFPRSDVARASRLPYNQVVRISVTTEGVHVYTEETPERQNLIYQFTPNFQFVSVSPSDYYAGLHDRLFREGKIGHRFSDCPESRNPPRPLEWRAGAWHELRPSASHR